VQIITSRRLNISNGHQRFASSKTPSGSEFRNTTPPNTPSDEITGNLPLPNWNSSQHRTKYWCLLTVPLSLTPWDSQC
jgi:hypothetical protein